MLKYIKKIIPNSTKAQIKEWRRRSFPKSYSPQEYWTMHNVSNHRKFNNAEESLSYFNWRTLQYFGMFELLRLDNANGKTVLDYGCGPGHDIVGFITQSPDVTKVIGMDVSHSSIEEAKSRVTLHEKTPKTDFILIDEETPVLPLDDNSIDIIHSSGVLHHTPVDTHKRIISEFKRILKPSGYAQIMVYNYDSLLVHLYFSYIMRVEKNLGRGLDKRGLFSLYMDGLDCPIADCYRPCEYVKFIESIKIDVECEFIGSAISASELRILDKRYDAILDERLDDESRRFLYELTINDKGFPVFNNHIAGINACYIPSIRLSSC